MNVSERVSYRMTPSRSEGGAAGDGIGSPVMAAASPLAAAPRSTSERVLRGGMCTTGPVQDNVSMLHASRADAHTRAMRRLHGRCPPVWIAAKGRLFLPPCSVTAPHWRDASTSSRRPRISAPQPCAPPTALVWPDAPFRPSGRFEPLRTRILSDIRRLPADSNDLDKLRGHAAAAAPVREATAVERLVVVALSVTGSRAIVEATAD